MQSLVFEAKAQQGFDSVSLAAVLKRKLGWLLLSLFTEGFFFNRETNCFFQAK